MLFALHWTLLNYTQCIIGDIIMLSASSVT
jgi:hypothetical protein